MILKAKYLFKAILNAIEEINFLSLNDRHEKISIRFQEKTLTQIILKRGYIPKCRLLFMCTTSSKEDRVNVEVHYLH